MTDTMHKQVGYAQKSGEFSKTLDTKILAYFQKTATDRYLPPAMKRKFLILFSLWAILYYSLLTTEHSTLSLFFNIILFHITLFEMALTAHDGSHNAVSANPVINKLVYRIFDLTGVNSYLWEYDHVIAHHDLPNVSGYDSNMYMYPFIRLDPNAPLKWYHRYQHYYALFIYAHATIAKVFIADFVNFTRPYIGKIYVGRHSLKAVAYLLFTKTVAIGYIYVIPILVIDAPTWMIILFIYIGQLITGIALGMIFQVTHTNTKVVQVSTNKKGKIEDSYEHHVFVTTADFAVDNKLITWLTGGLNIHTVHHMFPRISHMNLPAIANIVRDTAPEFNITYHEFPTWRTAIQSHFKALKKLGSKPYHKQKT